MTALITLSIVFLISLLSVLRLLQTSLRDARAERDALLQIRITAPQMTFTSSYTPPRSPPTPTDAAAFASIGSLHAVKPKPQED